MKQFLTGFLAAALIASISLNVAQYKGTLASPQVVKLEETDQQKLAGILEGM